MMTTTMTRSTMRLCGLLVAATALAPSLAGATATRPEAGGGLQLAPAGGASSLVFQARAGATVHAAVRVSNLSQRPRVVRLSATDLTTASTGGPVYGSGRPTRNGRWISPGRRDVRLAGRQSRIVRVTLRVPAWAKAGDHYAGLVAGDRSARVSARTRSGSRGRGPRVQVTQVVRYALPVKVRLRGHRARRLSAVGSRTAIDARGASIRVGVANVGNALIQNAKIDLDITRDGRRVLHHRATIGQFVPESRIAYPITLPRVPSSGDYRVRGTIRPAGAPTLRIDETVHFTSTERHELHRQAAAQGIQQASGGIPGLLWVALAAAAGLIAALVIALAGMRRRLRAPGA
ncbi:MAG: hypothetical protein JWN65_1000 [Solirubrobacterales bacterium]|nr:hypothetical protein [Solirubrobacterales bacterium]